MNRAKRVGVRSLKEDTRGATAAEFALVLPAFIAILFGSIELSRFVWIRSSLQSAVEAAARCSAINAPDCTTIAATKDFALEKSLVSDAAASAFNVTTEACGRTVTASYAFVPLMPLIPLSATITAKSCRALKPGP